MPTHDTTDTSAPAGIHLPVLPTGRADALRQPMQDTTPIPSPAAASTGPAPAGEPLAVTDVPAPSPIELKRIEGKVIEAIRQIYDPEIPVNIHELGLIYNVDVKPDRSVHVTMTLTAPACPVAGTLPGQVETKIEEVPEVTRATVELVWDPPWSREMMSEAAQLQLGFL